MPNVVPLPLGGLATELGDLTENLRALEQVRSGIAASFVTITTTATWSTWTAPAGWPSLSVSIAGNGSAFYIAGVLGGTGSAAQLAVAIDGAVPTVSSTVPFFVAWFQPGLALGLHTFSVVMNSGTATVNNPFLVVVPV